jgi:hypothetical protein
MSSTEGASDKAQKLGVVRAGTTINGRGSTLMSPTVVQSTFRGPHDVPPRRAVPGGLYRGLILACRPCSVECSQTLVHLSFPLLAR